MRHAQCDHSFTCYTRFIPAKAEQYLEHYIRNELMGVAAYFTDLDRMEA
jgi:hypothetical protein